MATINTYRKFREVWKVVVRHISRDRHTDMLIAILCTPTGVKYEPVL